MQLISFVDERGRNSLQNDTLPNIVTLLFNLLFQSELLILFFWSLLIDNEMCCSNIYGVRGVPCI